MDITIGNAGSDLPQTITAIAALFAALIGPALAYIAVRHQTRRTTVSSHRQAWIDGLRRDIASLVVACTELHARGPKMGDIADLSDDDLKAVYRVQDLLSMIELRLNPTEAEHNELLSSLHGLIDVAAANADFSKPRAKAMAVAKRVLKTEWNVVKAGG